MKISTEGRTLSIKTDENKIINITMLGFTCKISVPNVIDVYFSGEYFNAFGITITYENTHLKVSDGNSVADFYYKYNPVD